MNIRFYNGRILTMKDMSILEDYELWVKGNKIYYIGKYKVSLVDNDSTSKFNYRISNIEYIN